MVAILGLWFTATREDWPVVGGVCFGLIFGFFVFRFFLNSTGRRRQHQYRGTKYSCCVISLVQDIASWI